MLLHRPIGIRIEMLSLCTNQNSALDVSWVIRTRFFLLDYFDQHRAAERNDNTLQTTTYTLVK